VVERSSTRLLTALHMRIPWSTAPFTVLATQRIRRRGGLGAVAQAIISIRAKSY